LKILINKLFLKLIALADRLWHQNKLRRTIALAHGMKSKFVLFDAEFGRFLLDLSSYEDHTLFTHGDLEPHLAPLFASFIRGDSLVIDVGANCGIHTIFFSDLLRKSETGGGVIAFEPHPRLFSRLLTNIRLNGAENRIHAHNLACMDTQDDRILFGINASRFEQGNHSLLRNEKIEGFLKDSIEQIPVTTRRLDQVILEGNYGLPVSFIKIDVEGAEHAVLKGTSEILRQYRPTVLLEFRCNRLRHLGIEAHDFQVLANLEYHLYAIERDGSVSPITDLGHHIHDEKSTSTELLAVPFKLVDLGKARATAP
jgi:FkbM family methyltransferase